MGARPHARRRGWWRGAALLAVLGAAVALGGLGRPPEPGREAFESRPEAPLSGRVVEVTDGDTVIVRLSDGALERVRYIGVDTPESDPRRPLECFGLAAKAANARMVAGRTVLVEAGAEPRDVYGRLLAYVSVSGRLGPVLVNEALVRRGFARTLTIPPNDALAPRLSRLEAAAGRRGRGLWSACS
jgi:micrococcal nuclease